MGAGYRPQRLGLAGVVARLASLQRQIDALRATSITARITLGPEFGPTTVPYSMGPTLVQGPGEYAWRAPAGCVIGVIAATLGVGPDSTPVVVDVNLDGDSVFPTVDDRLEIAPGATEAVSASLGVVVPVGGLLTVDLDQIDDAAQSLVVTVQLLGA